MKAIFLIALAVVGTQARFEKLKETCETDQGVGICVQSESCCLLVHGQVLPEVKLNARDSFPGKLRFRAIDQELSGCSYNGVCCVLPEVDTPDCSVCGVLGDGTKAVSTERQDPPIVPVAAEADVPVLKKLEERIVNAYDAPQNRWCWQVAFLNSTGLIGGGSLIARNWVITAAHNLAGLFLDQVIVAVGLYSFAHGADDIVYYSTPTGVALNPGFNPATNDNDLALVRIPSVPCEQDSVCLICLPEEPVSFEPVTTTTSTTSTTTTTTTTTTQATTTVYSYGAPVFQASFDPKNTLNIILSQIVDENGQQVIVDTDGNIVPIQENPFESDICFITGWGSTGISPVAPVLQEAAQMIITPQQCAADLADMNVPEEKIVLPAINSYCVRDPVQTNDAASSCVGDGGGPLACQVNNQHGGWELRGVIILGTNMCMSGNNNGPTIVANVGEYLEWIEEIVHSDLPGPPAADPYKVPLCGENIEDDDGLCPERVHPEGRQGLAEILRVLPYLS